MDSKDKKTQADKFREAAKELETDNDEKRFDENLKKLADDKTKPDGDDDGGYVSSG